MAPAVQSAPAAGPALLPSPFVVATAQAPLDPFEPDQGRARRQPWSRRVSGAALGAGAGVAVVSLCVGLAAGGPVLGHVGRPLIALAGVAGVGGGLLLAGRAWGGTGRVARLVSVVVSALLAVSFVVGTLTNPVVVEGRVFLSTSPQARSYRLIQQVRGDLLELAAADKYLTYDAAQAGAHYNDYAPLENRLSALSDSYAKLSADQRAWPDARFATVLSQTTAAAYWAQRAMTSKVEVIDSDNAKSESDLSTNRASYAQSVVEAGQSLKQLAGDLNLPLTAMGPTE